MIKSPRVFVSYSQDSIEHKLAVLTLANRLRADGVDCRIDQYVESSPPEGWPRWMAREIEAAEFVLVVCTETYRRRVEGREPSTDGRGSAWEGLLLTQDIYENQGRNSKFVPVLLSGQSQENIPKYLLPATRFRLDRDGDYERLLRALTQQPGVRMPPLGPVPTLPPLDGTNADDAGSTKATSIVFAETPHPRVIWRLPRGFIVLEDLVDRGDETWSTIASYHDYRGQWIASTHYHETYRWSPRDMNSQFRKLGIPRADHMYAYGALDVMMEVRGGKIVVSPSGYASGKNGEITITGPRVSIIRPGTMFLPTVLSEDRVLASSGPLRDLLDEAEEILADLGKLARKPILEIQESKRDIARVRREVRLEVHRLFSSSHPAVRNLEEIIDRYQPDSQVEGQLAWFIEFREATAEAVRCVHEEAG